MEAAVYYRSFDEHYEISGCCVRNISRGGGRWAVGGGPSGAGAAVAAESCYA